MKIKVLKRLMQEFLPDGCEFQLTICPACVTASIHDYEDHVTSFMQEGVYADFLQEDDPDNDTILVNKSSIIDLLNEVRQDRGLSPI